MGYPFPSLGGFLFKTEETAIFDTDSGWGAPIPQLQRAVPLGGNKDIVVNLGLGSQTRTFECLLSEQRFNALRQLTGQATSFCDWARPVPDERDVQLLELTQVGRALVTCKDANGLAWRIRARIALLEI